MSRLDGKIIIVTGSTQGIGAAIASLCAEQGAAGLVICGRNEENGKAVARAIDQCLSSLCEPTLNMWLIADSSSAAATKGSVESMG